MESNKPVKNQRGRFVSGGICGGLALLMSCLILVVKHKPLGKNDFIGLIMFICAGIVAGVLMWPDENRTPPENLTANPKRRTYFILSTYCAGASLGLGTIALLSALRGLDKGVSVLHWWEMHPALYFVNLLVLVCGGAALVWFRKGSQTLPSS